MEGPSLPLTATLPMGRDDGLLAEVARRVLDEVAGQSTPPEEVVNRTLREEAARLAAGTNAPRDAADQRFYRRLGARFHRAPGALAPELLETLVGHYLEEIAGHFDRRVYRLATHAVPAILTGLLHGLDPLGVLSQPLAPPNLSAHLRLEGATDALVQVAQLGPVVLVPTHSSNLDSLVLGHAIHALGLPPFAYGAGLNLFSHRVLGVFMHHLGAYTIDRRKTDPLYRQTLKELVTCALARGQHQLFFPGGTRSHSGALETSLKKGLLGTALAALPRTPGGRVFVVPCTVTYPIVLEADSLITGWLESEGRERFIHRPDEFDRIHVWLQFLRSVAALDLEVRVVFGAPLDPLGNEVRALDGASIAGGRAVEPGHYLRSGGQFAPDPARDAELSRRLERALLASYRQGAVVLPSHVVAFAAFECLRARGGQRDVFRLLAELGRAPRITKAELSTAVERTLRALRDPTRALRLDTHLEGSPAEVLRLGAKTLAAFHTRPALVARGGAFVVESPTLLLFYRNRLEHLGLSAPLLGRAS